MAWVAYGWTTCSKYRQVYRCSKVLKKLQCHVPRQYVPTSYTSMTIALDCDMSQLSQGTNIVISSFKIVVDMQKIKFIMNVVPL